MKSRRSFLAGAAFFGLSSTIRTSAAQEWPSRPIRLICPFPAGAGVDISARIMAEALSKRLGVGVAVENHVGAGGVIGMEYVARAEPDGYTLGFPAGDSISILPAFKKSLPYKVPEDFSFVAKFVETGVSITTRADLPVKTVQELVVYAKNNPGRVKAGTGGVAAAADIATYLFENSTGTKLAHIPYRGMGPAIVDLLGSHIDLVFAAPSSVLPIIDTGRVRVLAVTSKERSPLFPNAPTVHELGLETAAFTNWYGMVAPAKTPQTVIDRLQTEIIAAVKDPDLKEKVSQAALDLSPLYGTEFQKQVIDQLNAFRALGKAENISVD
jgi:tripartite-type tricarboxylate transporter receptor subunit TctC